MLLWHIGDVLRKLRESYPREDGLPGGLSRKELADKAGVSQNTLGDMERHVSNFEAKTLGKVLAALDVTVDRVYAELPGGPVPVTTDPVDAETIVRFLRLAPHQKHAVRTVIDTLGMSPDRQRAASVESRDAPAHPLRTSRTRSQ